MGNGFASTYKCHTNEMKVLNYNKIWCMNHPVWKRLDNALIRLDKWKNESLGHFLHPKT